MTRTMINIGAETPKNDEVVGRQIALAAAFLLPVSKLLEAPSLLAKYAAGDLLLPAILHFLLQFGVLFALVYAASKSDKTLFERLRLRFGRWSALFYVLYAVYFLFAAILPLFDLEKFTYAAFFDTAPTSFSFAFFFIFSAFVCVKGLKALGRAADFSHLLPLFGSKFGDTVYAFTRTTPHFSDAVLLLPFIGNLRYKKGDGVKILTGYGVGACSTLLFLAVFFGIYSSIAPREHYAFSKIAEYFPALDVIGRFDLLFVYMLTLVLLVFTAMPLQFTTDFICKVCHTRKKVLVATLLNLALLLLLLYANKFYNAVYALISGKLPFVFWLIADMLPLFFIFLPKMQDVKEDRRA